MVPESEKQRLAKGLNSTLDWIGRRRSSATTAKDIAFLNSLEKFALGLRRKLSMVRTTREIEKLQRRARKLETAVIFYVQLGLSIAYDSTIMNAQLLKKFSLEILRGATSVGESTEHLLGSILTPDQASLLEKKTGRSIGELAVLGIEYAATPEQKKRHRELLRETTDLMACLDKALRPASKNAVKKAAAR